jgi:hypothetical protein
MKIVHDLLPSDYKAHIQEVLFNDWFPWYWNDITKREVNGVKQNIFQLTHVFVEENQVTSDYFNLIDPMLDYIKQATGTKIKDVFRIKANLLPRQVCSEEDIANAIHVDTRPTGYVSFIYYLHDIDGDIKTYDKDCKVIDSYSPKENSLVHFNSNTLHGTRPPTQSKRRVCINFVLGTHD